MFARLKKLLGKAQENPTVQQVTTQAQQAVDTVQNVATSVVDQAKDIHAEVMADGKVTMDDFAPVKDAAQNLAWSVNEIATDVAEGTKEIVADLKDAHAEVMADGKVTMDDLGTVKDAAVEVVSNVKEIVSDAANPDSNPNTPVA